MEEFLALWKTSLRNGLTSMKPKKAYELILSTGTRCKVIENVIASDADFSHLYAKNFLKAPFVAGEEAIRKSPFAAYLYCKEIIKQRWYDAEDVIKKNPHSAYKYSLEIIGGRWKEAEKYILKSSMWSGAYAGEVLKGRFKAAEPNIAKNDSAASDYFSEVIKGNWEGWSEEEISISPVWMCHYARFIGQMLPEPMHSRMSGMRAKNEHAATYVKEFC